MNAGDCAGVELAPKCDDGDNAPLEAAEVAVWNIEPPIVDDVSAKYSDGEKLSGLLC